MKKLFKLKNLFNLIVFIFFPLWPPLWKTLNKNSNVLGTLSS